MESAQNTVILTFGRHFSEALHRKILSKNTLQDENQEEKMTGESVTSCRSSARTRGPGRSADCGRRRLCSVLRRSASQPGLEETPGKVRICATDQYWKSIVRHRGKRVFTKNAEESSTDSRFHKAQLPNISMATTAGPATLQSSPRSEFRKKAKN